MTDSKLDLKPDPTSTRGRNINLILRAAERVFSESGFKGASVRDVANVAGIPKASVYYYFGSKECLYRSICANICDLWMQAAAQFDCQSEPRAAFSSYIDAKMKLALSHPQASRVWAMEVASGGDFIKDHLRERVWPWLTRCEKVVQHWIAEGKIRQVETKYVFYFIWSSTQHYADFKTQITILNGDLPLNDRDYERAKTTIADAVFALLGIDNRSAPTGAIKCHRSLAFSVR